MKSKRAPRICAERKPRKAVPVCSFKKMAIRGGMSHTVCGNLYQKIILEIYRDLVSLEHLSSFSSNRKTLQKQSIE